MTYSGLLLVGVALIFIAFYFLLDASLSRKEDEVLRAKANEYAFITVPLVDINDFLVRRVAPDGHESFLKIGHGDSKLLEKLLVKADPPDQKEDEFWASIPVPGDEDIVRVISVRTPDGSLLQVGRRNNAIEGELEFFREKFLFLLFPSFLLSLFAGLYISKKALSPIRDLIQTTQAIYKGDLSARVEVIETGDELAELSLLTNQMLARIETLVGTLKDTLDNFAHDMRTPLARLRASAEMALDTADPKAKEEALAECLEESSAMLTLVNSLIELASSRSGTLQLHTKQASLKAIIESVVDLHTMVAQDSNISISVDAMEDLEVFLDPDQIRRALSNLLDNALKYTPEGGTIKIGVQTSTNHIAIYMTDSGIGIAPDDQPRIWERLYRVNSSRSDKGLGLGLSIVKAIVEAHNGKIEVESQLGKGSTFTIHLDTRKRLEFGS